MKENFEQKKPLSEKDAEKLVKGVMGDDAFEREDKNLEAKNLGAAAAKKEISEISPAWLHNVEKERNRLAGKVEVAEKNIKAAEKEFEEAKKKLEFFKKELVKAQDLLAELETEKKEEKLSKKEKKTSKEETLDIAA